MSFLVGDNIKNRVVILTNKVFLSLILDFLPIFDRTNVLSINKPYKEHMYKDSALWKHLVLAPTHNNIKNMTKSIPNGAHIKCLDLSYFRRGFTSGGQNRIIMRLAAIARLKFLVGTESVDEISIPEPKSARTNRLKRSRVQIYTRVSTKCDLVTYDLRESPTLSKFNTYDYLSETLPYIRSDHFGFRTDRDPIDEIEHLFHWKVLEHIRPSKITVNCTSLNTKPFIAPEEDEDIDGIPRPFVMMKSVKKFVWTIENADVPIELYSYLTLWFNMFPMLEDLLIVCVGKHDCLPKSLDVPFIPHLKSFRLYTPNHTFDQVMFEHTMPELYEFRGQATYNQQYQFIGYESDVIGSMVKIPIPSPFPLLSIQDQLDELTVCSNSYNHISFRFFQLP